MIIRIRKDVHCEEKDTCEKVAYRRFHLLSGFWGHFIYCPDRRRADLHHPVTGNLQSDHERKLAHHTIGRDLFFDYCLLYGCDFSSFPKSRNQMVGYRF